MKAKKFAVMLGLFALCIVASAQNYSVRTNFNTNLRATFSLQGSILETVPSGTTLLVVGNQSRWLRISRNGVEVWMANWVSHTRVAGGEQTQSPSQTSSNIDNCCFVDRLCSSDSEWNDGYFAYENGQCTAPSQTQTRTSSQPVNTGTSQLTIVASSIGNAIATQNGMTAISLIRMVNARRLLNLRQEHHRSP